RHAGVEIPTVLPLVPSPRVRRVGCERRDLLPEERTAGAALAVGGRDQKIAVGNFVAVCVAPASRVRTDEMPGPRGAVVCPLVAGVGFRHVTAEEDLRRGVSVAKHIVRRTEPRHQVLLVQRAGLSWKHYSRRQEAVWPHFLLREVVGQALETEPAIQRQMTTD